MKKLMLIFAVLAAFANSLTSQCNFDDDIEGVGKLMRKPGGGFTFQKQGAKPGAGLALQPAGQFKASGSNDRDRDIFQNAVTRYKQEGRFVTPGFLRIEVKIINGRSRYVFSCVKDSNSDQVTETKLDRNDKFLISDIGLFMIARLTTLTGIEILQTYPNPVIFPDYTSTFKGAHLESFYNGFISIKVGQTVYIEKLDTRRFRVVGNSQAALGGFYAVNASGVEALAADIGVATKQLKVDNTQSTGNDGFQKLTPQFEIDGDGKTEISIEAPVHVNALVENKNASTDNYLVLVARGLLAAKK